MVVYQEGFSSAHTCQLKLKAIYGGCCTNPSRPHPLTPSPPGEGELNFLLPSPGGRGAGGEGRTLSPSGLHVTLTPISIAKPLPLTQNSCRDAIHRVSTTNYSLLTNNPTGKCASAAPMDNVPVASRDC